MYYTGYQGSFPSWKLFFPDWASRQHTDDSYRCESRIPSSSGYQWFPQKEAALPEVEALCRESSMEVEAFIHGDPCATAVPEQCLFKQPAGQAQRQQEDVPQPHCRQPYRILTRKSRR